MSSNESDDKENTTEQENTLAFLAQLESMPSAQNNPVRAIGLYGEITEDLCHEAIIGILELEKSGTHMEPIAPDSEEVIEVYEPFDFYISTFGGSALDMFAVYDLMRLVRKKCSIKTIGLGKVMSAGILLLAGGTKGYRRVGKNCRLMIHGVISGQQGNIPNIENEMDEARWTQNQFVKALSKESNMSQRDIKKMMNKKLNVYFDAEQAVELGIADEVI